MGDDTWILGWRSGPHDDSSTPRAWACPAAPPYPSRFQSHGASRRSRRPRRRIRVAGRRRRIRVAGRSHGASRRSRRGFWCEEEDPPARPAREVTLSRPVLRPCRISPSHFKAWRGRKCIKDVPETRTGVEVHDRGASAAREGGRVRGYMPAQRTNERANERINERRY